MYNIPRYIFGLNEPLVFNFSKAYIIQAQSLHISINNKKNKGSCEMNESHHPLETTVA